MLQRIEAGELPWGSAPELPDVAPVVQAVRLGGDAAVAAYAQIFGDPPPRRVPPQELEAAHRGLNPALRGVIADAARRIERFARLQRASVTDSELACAGTVIGHRCVPVERVGMYVPGGRYSLPSTVLMCAVPARVAGVSHVTMCTPRAAPAALAAAYVAGVDECFEIGGAQAIAAMAFGTGSVHAVDLIVGPGNAYVTAAKRAVFGTCGIDMLAGPSEIAIVASEDANPAYVAADLLAQAEHDDIARTLLVTDGEALVRAVERELVERLASLSTAGVARASLARNGRVAVTHLERCVEWMDRIAPEHLALHGRGAEALASRFRCYGTLFAGSAAAEVFADYGVGPNHVLPTGANARFASGLSVFTFLTSRTFVRGSGAPSAALIAQTAALAEAEGLCAHRDAALVRASA